jgi:hypothetical protein
MRCNKDSFGPFPTFQEDTAVFVPSVQSRDGQRRPPSNFPLISAALPHTIAEGRLGVQPAARSPQPAASFLSAGRERRIREAAQNASWRNPSLAFGLLRTPQFGGGFWPLRRRTPRFLGLTPHAYVDCPTVRPPCSAESMYLCLSRYARCSGL